MKLNSFVGMRAALKPTRLRIKSTDGFDCALNRFSINFIAKLLTTAKVKRTQNNQSEGLRNVLLSLPKENGKIKSGKNKVAVAFTDTLRHSFE